MIIKKGYADEEQEVRIETRGGDRVAGFWIKQYSQDAPRHELETLAYITLDELLDLRDEINKAIKQIVGVV